MGPSARGLLRQRRQHRFQSMQKTKVTRGGSWINGKNGARADLRYNDHPLNRDIYNGFRVCKKIK